MQPLPGSVFVVGLGVSGVAAVRYLLAHRALGTPVDVVAYDGSDSPELQKTAEELRSAGARVILGASAVEGAADLAVVSPGIPPASSLRRSATEQSARVVGELEFAYERSRSPWLAITGTNGKTTVTSLVAHLLESGGVPTECVGNIGAPAIEVVDEAGRSTAIVAEVSSFQLALTDRFCPRVAVLLNITPDHIDWHGSLAAYTADKVRVFENQGCDDTAVIDIDDAGSAPFADVVEARGVRVARVSRFEVPGGGAGLENGMLVLDTPSGHLSLIPAEELRIRGNHNVSNALAAAAAAHAWGVDAQAIREGLRTFEPIAHRLEPVDVIAGVEYVNDSKATNPGAAQMALTAFERPLIVLLGGRNKGNEFDELARDVVGIGARAVVFGEARAEIAQALVEAGADPVVVETMLEAVNAAAARASAGDAVLLSPACASFDEFKGYADRGRVFREIVATIASSPEAAR